MTAVKTVTKADFARMSGVTGAAVTKALGKGLREALVGTRIDTGHPAAAAYLAAHGGARISTPRGTAQSGPDQLRVASMQIKLAEQAGALIKREFVEVTFARLRGILVGFVNSGARAVAVEVCRDVPELSASRVEGHVAEGFQRFVDAMVEEIDGVIRGL